MVIVLLALFASLIGLVVQSTKLGDCGTFGDCPLTFKVGFPVPISGSESLTDYLYISAFATNFLLDLMLFSVGYYIYSNKFKKIE